MEKTNEKRNLMKRIMLMLCAAVVAISTVLGSGVTEVQAASKAKKAMAAYAKYLQDGSHWNMDGKMTSFGLIDVNRDGIKELVVYDESTYSTILIGYVSGKTKQLGWCMRGEIKIYPKKKIFALYDSPEAGMYDRGYYKYDGKKAQSLAGYYVEYDGGGGKLINETYNVHGKNVSKKKYNKYIKSLHLGKGISSDHLKMHKNTAANRKKYLGFDGMPEGSIAIDSKNFPDTTFRAYISQYIDQEVDGKKDGYLSKKEQLAVTDMEVWSRNIKSLKGVENFTNLKILNCSNNPIKKLDISHNYNLQKVDCSECDITSLDISQNYNLQDIDCSSCGLTSLDVSNNFQLTDLSCIGCKLTSLDVSNNSNLSWLCCDQNAISYLDLTQNPNLCSLEFNCNNISSIDLSQNPNLELLECVDNPIEILDLSQNPNLSDKNLWCESDVIVIR